MNFKLQFEINVTQKQVPTISAPYSEPEEWLGPLYASKVRDTFIKKRKRKKKKLSTNTKEAKFLKPVLVAYQAFKALRSLKLILEQYLICSD